MKKITATLLLVLNLLVRINNSNAQQASQYSFNSSSATYSPITNGNVLGTSTNWKMAFNYIPIGFTFNYLGANFTAVHILSNGSIKFGAPIDGYQTASCGSLIDNALTQDTIVAFLDMYELWGAGVGVLQYTTTGVSPNRVFTVQWSNYALDYNEDLNFQLKLYETTNKIQAHYGLMMLDVGSGTSILGQLGLRGDFINLYDIVGLDAGVSSGPGSWATPAVTTTTLTYPYSYLDIGPPQVKPNNGRRHTWTPPPACSGGPNAGVSEVFDYSPFSYYINSTPVPIDTACAGTPIFLFLTGNSVASGLTYQWQTSTNNTTWTAIPSATTSSWTDIFNSSLTTWYRCVVSCGSNTAASVPHQIFAPTPITEPTVASSTIACAGGSVTVDVFNIGVNSIISNYYALTYTWQTSSNNVTWTSTPTPTTPYWTTTFTTPTYYRAIVGCGTNTVLSIPVLVNTYTGTPTAGTTIASFTSACAIGQPVMLNLSGATNTVPGLSSQWQSSPNGVSWTSIPSATVYPYPWSQPFTPSFFNTVYYQNIISCGSNSAVSVPVNIINTGAPLTFTSTPYLENFDNTWQNRCDIQNVPVSANWSSNPTTGNNSWRRQDAGASASWTTPTTATISPLTGNGCANFHSTQANYNAGSMELYIDLSGTTPYNLSFYHKNPTGDEYFGVFLSTNSGATFSNISGYYQSGDYNTIEANWNKKTINLGVVNSPSCIVRFYAGGGGYAGLEDLAIDSLEIKACISNMSLTASSNTVCSGNPVTLSVTGSASSYTWSTGSNASFIILNPTSSTIFSVTATSTLGCTSSLTQSVTINVNPLPGSLSANPPAVCTGSSSSLSLASTANTYSWSTGSTNSVIAVSPTVATIYIVMATTSLGCSSTQSVMLNINPSPTISIASLNSICFGGTLSLNAIGANSYTWSVGSQTTSAIIVTPIISMIYSVTGFAGSCSAIASKSITVNPLPAINISPSQSLCLPTSGLVFLNASSAGNTFTWQPGGQVNSNISVTPQNSVSTTVYSVNATSPLGCINTEITSIIVQNCTGIKNNSLSNITKIYPNPAEGFVKVLIDEFKAGSHLKIFNTLGQIILEQELTSSDNEINCSELTKGVYQIIIVQNSQIISRNKLIKN